MHAQQTTTEKEKKKTRGKYKATRPSLVSVNYYYYYRKAARPNSVTGNSYKHFDYSDTGVFMIRQYPLWLPSCDCQITYTHSDSHIQQIPCKQAKFLPVTLVCIMIKHSSQECWQNWTGHPCNPDSDGADCPTPTRSTTDWSPSTTSIHELSKLVSEDTTRSISSPTMYPIFWNRLQQVLIFSEHQSQLE